MTKICDEHAEDFETDLLNNPGLDDPCLYCQIKELEADRKLLRALQGAGVDNWDGYDIAVEMMDD